jgi:hypothetical protein
MLSQEQTEQLKVTDFINVQVQDVQHIPAVLNEISRACKLIDRRVAHWQFQVVTFEVEEQVPRMDTRLLKKGEGLFGMGSDVVRQTGAVVYLVVQIDDAFQFGELMTEETFSDGQDYAPGTIRPIRPVQQPRDETVE